jgi:hypothetical protein
MEPSCKNLSLPRFASNQSGFQLAIRQAKRTIKEHGRTDFWRQSEEGARNPHSN